MTSPNPPTPEDDAAAKRARLARERRNRAARALGDPFYFGELYVRPYDEAWVEQLPPFAEQMLGFALGQRRGAVILPPEFLKTTLLSQVLPLWLTYRYSFEKKLLRGMLLAEEEGMSQRNLSVVGWHIENNEGLAHDFAADGMPLVFPDPEENVWREDALIVARRGASKDPTWQAKGLDSKGIQGRRLDFLLGDDVITPKNAFSAAMRRNALNLWDMQITTRLVRDGKAIIAGNFNHERDLISTLAERKSYAVFRRPASHVAGDPETAMHPAEPGAVMLWPENWDRKRLLQEFEDKPERARRIFLLDPRAERGDRLKLEWVQTIDPRATPTSEATYYLSLDPAAGGVSHDLDFFNVTVLAAHGSNLDLIASIDVRRSIPDQLDLVGAIHDRFQRLGNGVVCIAGAKVAMDRYMRGALIAVRPDLAPKVLEVSIPGDKNTRLEALGPRAKSGEVRVWETVWEELTSDAPDQSQELTLMEQWKDFPNGRHDDKLDGLDVGIRAFDKWSPVEDVECSLVAQ